LEKDKAVVLLSGGVDSATVLFMAAEKGYDVLALTFNYGQKNLFEIECAKKLAALARVRAHKILKIDLGAFGGSSITSDKKADEKGKATYVPARNTIFLSFALAWAEAESAGIVFYGANSIDFGGYPDCTEEYIKAFNKLARKGLLTPVKIEAPLLEMTKKEIVEKGISLGIDYSLTNSCYFPNKNGAHCGVCSSCIIRMKALNEVKNHE
jgi:7-cyano-7-deazaguanine synthase